MTRVFVTGLGGFVAHHFLEHVLSTTDWEVAGTDSFRHKGKTDRIAGVLEGHGEWQQRLTVITHDLTAPLSRQALGKVGDVDYIVAFASESHVDRSISSPVDFTLNNVSVALNTLEAARSLHPKAVFWISTDEVYGPVEADNLKGHKEWATILPSNPYSGSKAAQEAIAISYWRTYGVPVIILNIMNMIGERQDPEKFVPMTIKKVSRGETVTIHGTPEHIGTRHYLHCRNLADAIMFLIHQESVAMFPAHAPLHTKTTGIRSVFTGSPDRYNVATPDRVDNLSLAQMIADDCGTELKYSLEDFHTTRPGHDPHYGLNPRRIMKLGWEPPVSFRDSLSRLVKWTLEHQEWLIDD